MLHSVHRKCAPRCGRRMENGCHDCVGPIPLNPTAAAGAAPAKVRLLPFGATDIRLGVMPAIWKKAGAAKEVAAASPTTES